MDDRVLLAALSPVATGLLDRHLATAKEWFPHQLVPWSRAGADRAEPPAGIPSGVEAALALNVLTEDNLPRYFAALVQRFGDDDPWRAWTMRWTAEEMRHATVLRQYLSATGTVDLRWLERARVAYVSASAAPAPPSVADAIVYLALQELATRIAHRNTGRAVADPAGYGIMSRIAADENLHHLFYRDLAAAALDVDPGSMLPAIEAQARHFAMPGVEVPGFAGLAREVASAGIYSAAIFHDEVLAPALLTHWRLPSLTGLPPEAERARDRALRVLDRLGRAARRLSEAAAAGSGGGAARPDGS